MCIKNKLHNIFWKNVTIIAILSVLCVISIYMSFVLYNKKYDELFVNKARYFFSDSLEKIQNGDYSNLDYPCSIFDIDGSVLYSDLSQYKYGNKYNLNECLQFDKGFYNTNKNEIKYSFVLHDSDEKTIGFVVFIINRNQISGSKYYLSGFIVLLPVIIFLIIMFIILICEAFYLKKFILSPIKKINFSSKAIMNGNYDVSVKDSANLAEDEVCTLIYNFELMRDELKERIIREEKLKKTQKELISCMSHDLKTPISTIKAYAEGLLDNIVSDDYKKRKYENIILNKANLVNKMINDLLDHSNAELGMLKICMRQINLGEYFDSIEEEIRDYLANQNIEFIYQSDLKSKIAYIDEDRITEVIYNILENAVKYKNKQDAYIKMTVIDKYEYVLVSIYDNGIGINSSDIPYIFDKFYRAEKSRSMRIPGSGLGLSICRYIINMHGGSIECSSRINEYTKINFTIRFSKL